MAYAATSDVQALFPDFTFSGSTKPTTTQVGEFLSQVESEINGVLRALDYPTVPATDDDDAALLKMYAAQKTCVKTWFAAYRNVTPPAHIVAYQDEYTAFLSRLRKREQYLPSQKPASGAGVGAVTFARRDTSGSEYA